MKNKNDTIIFKILFFLMVLTLPFMYIYPVLPFTIISGLFMKATTYFAVIAICMYSIKQYKNNKNFTRVFVIYIFVLCTTYIISFVYGYYTFDFPELLISNIGGNAEKIFFLLCSKGINIDRELYACLLTFCKFIIKETLISSVILFGITWFVICLFNNKFNDAINIFNKAVLLILIVSACYSIVEVGYVKGYKWPTESLAWINKHLYYISTDNSVTWPPLLWGERFRSIFPECSYCAIFLSSVLPIYMLTFENDNKCNWVMNKLNYALLFCVFFLLFATDSKTAMVLIGCLIAYVVGLTIMNSSTFLYKGLTILLCIVVSGFSYFILVKTPYIIKAESPLVQASVINNLGGIKKWNIGYNSIPSKQYKLLNQTENNGDVVAKDGSSAERDINKYFEKNIYNVANVNYGSNSSRYGITFAEIRVWLDYPVWGTGSVALMQPYMYSRFPEFSDNEEIRRWKNFNIAKGVMSNHFPVLNGLTNQLASNGILCFLVFYSPLIYFIYIVTCKKWNSYSMKVRNIVCALLMSLFCIFVSCMSASLNLFLTYWIVLGILGAVAYSDEFDE